MGSPNNSSSGGQWRETRQAAWACIQLRGLGVAGLLYTWTTFTALDYPVPSARITEWMGGKRAWWGGVLKPIFPVLSQAGLGCGGQKLSGFLCCWGSYLKGGGEEATGTVTVGTQVLEGPASHDVSWVMKQLQPRPCF